MAEVINKVITVESLAALHTHNQDTYMTKDDPTGVGTMTMTGDGNFSGIVDAGALQLGDTLLQYNSTDGILEISFLTNETTEEE